MGHGQTLPSVDNASDARRGWSLVSLDLVCDRLGGSRVVEGWWIAWHSPSEVSVCPFASVGAEANGDTRIGRGRIARSRVTDGDAAFGNYAQCKTAGISRAGDD